MSKSRNARRMIAKQRLMDKTVRIAKASLAADLDAKREIVKRNLGSPIERNCYPQSIMAVFTRESHRGLVSRASGSMSKRSTLAVMAKSANKTRDTYARPKPSDDRSNWPVVTKGDVVEKADKKIDIEG